MNWTAAVDSLKPSVITGDRVAVHATDSYGDPATQGGFSVTATGAPTLSPTFGATAGTIVDGQGSSQVTDHQAQTVALTVHTHGPYAGHDDHAITISGIAFQPGPPAAMTLAGKSPVTAGQTDSVGGVVTDRYGNPVLPSALDFTATAGTVDSPVTTGSQGAYAAGYTAPEKLTATPGTPESVAIDGRSVQGSAQGRLTVQIDPGPVAKLTLSGPSSPVSPGQTVTLNGTAVDRYGNAVLDGTPVTASATGGSVSGGSLHAGRFTLTYTAPSTPGSYDVTATAQGISQSVPVTVTAPIPAGSVIRFGSPQSQSNGRVAVPGTVSTAAGQPVADALVSLSAQGGTLTTSQVVTNAQGQFTAEVTPASSSSPVTVTAAGTTASGGTVQGAVGIDPLVFGNQPWTDTAIPVQAGQEVTITATGGWASQLQARLGSMGVPIAVGANGTFVAGASGTLYLGPGATLQSGTVDALVSVRNLSNVLPTMDWTAAASQVAPNGTVGLSGQLMMGTVPVADAPITLTTTAGTLDDPATTVTAVTDGQGRFTATFNAPASGSATITATYTPPSGSAIQQSLTETVQAAATLQLAAGSQSLVAGSGSTTTIVGTLTQNGAPISGAPVALSVQDGSLSATQATTDSAGQFRVTYTAGATAGTATVTASADGVSQSATITLASASTTASFAASGGPQVPALSGTSTTLDAGWTTRGTAYRYPAGTAASPAADGGWINLAPGASASYAFTVTGSQSVTLAYGIPAGGYQNDTSVQVAVNGQVVATLTNDIGVNGSQAASNEVLWSRSFAPGSYTLTLTAGPTSPGINVYGLWTDNAGALSSGTASTSSGGTAPAGMTGSPMPAGTQATASSAFSPDVAGNAIDGNLGTAWNSGSGTGVLTLQFPSPQSISALGIAANASPATTESYTIQGLTSGGWVTIGQATPYVDSTSSSAAYFTIPVTAGTYSAVRLSINGEHSWVSINEITLNPTLTSGTTLVP